MILTQTESLKVIAFDLGDTLVEYEGLPLSWESHYAAALLELAAHAGASPDSEQLQRASTVLRGFNTRIQPREKEVQFAKILSKILLCFDVKSHVGELEGARAFFRVFRHRLRCFPDTAPALSALRGESIKVGVFTDVPYGMPVELVLEDISTAGLDGLLDLVVTSSEAGFRKPSPVTLRYLADAFRCEPAEMAYVGNEKKDVKVAKAFGCRAILLDRNLHGSPWGQDRTISSLAEFRLDRTLLLKP